MLPIFGQYGPISGQFGPISGQMALFLEFTKILVPKWSYLYLLTIFSISDFTQISAPKQALAVLTNTLHSTSNFFQIGPAIDLNNHLDISSEPSIL